jgi:hypothetical protein
MEFNINLGIYIIVAIFTIAGGSYKFYSDSQNLAALLFFVGTLAVFIVFGQKWFSSNAIFSKTPVSWPPTINTCPDYLVYYKRRKAGNLTEDTCIDLIGVSKDSSIKVFPKDQLFPKDPKQLSPEDNNYYFSLTTTTTSEEAKKKELCDRTKSMKLTWEGITNGDSCTITSTELNGSAPK